MSLDVCLTADPCPTCGAGGEVYEANITHNLNDMAEKAGIYLALWRPDECGVERAKDIIGALRLGLNWLKRNPEEAKKQNPANGWGDYEGFVTWVEQYLAACEKHPEARVKVWR